MAAHPEQNAFQKLAVLRGFLVRFVLAVVRCAGAVCERLRGVVRQSGFPRGSPPQCGKPLLTFEEMVR
jgi:hypothetical protein